MSNSFTSKDSARWDAFRGSAVDNSAIKILAVDDNEALRYSLVRSLRDAGYRVVEARTGTEALSLAAQMPDLITLDVNLPDIDGFQVCRRLKADPATTHIPILHVSSTSVDLQSRVQGLEGGADAYLTEPIDRAELVATVGALLRLKQAEIAARQQAEAAEKARQELAQLNATLENRVAERTMELKTANANLRELSGRLLQIQDEERRRLARELHDGVGQLLAAISMNISLVQTESAKLSPATAKAVAENESFVRQISRDIRTISYLLHPPLLDESGLPSALPWYVEEFSKRSGINVTLDCPPSVGRFSCELETAIFRIIQECLGNIHRHADSPTAAIRLEADERTVRLVVSDTGKGIPSDQQRQLISGMRTGVGIRGMQERVAQLAGLLTIESGAGGTTITATLPCAPADSASFREEVA